MRLLQRNQSSHGKECRSWYKKWRTVWCRHLKWTQHEMCWRVTDLRPARTSCCIDKRTYSLSQNRRTIRKISFLVGILLLAAHNPVVVTRRSVWPHLLTCSVTLRTYGMRLSVVTNCDLHSACLLSSVKVDIRCGIAAYTSGAYYLSFFTKKWSASTKLLASSTVQWVCHPMFRPSQSPISLQYRKVGKLCFKNFHQTTNAIYTSLCRFSAHVFLRECVEWTDAPKSTSKFVWISLFSRLCDPFP